MASPRSKQMLKLENDADSRKIQFFIESVDERKPLGKLIRTYADQYYVDGWWNGFFTGCFVASVSITICISVMRR